MSEPEFVVRKSDLQVTMPGILLARVVVPGSIDTRWFGLRYDGWYGWTAVGVVADRFAPESTVRPAPLEYVRLYLAWERARRDYSVVYGWLIDKLNHAEYKVYWPVPAETAKLSVFEFGDNWELRIGGDGALWSITAAGARRYHPDLHLSTLLLVYLAEEKATLAAKQALLAAESRLREELKRQRLDKEQAFRVAPAEVVLKLPDLCLPVWSPRSAAHYALSGQAPLGALACPASFSIKIGGCYAVSLSRKESSSLFILV